MNRSQFQKMARIRIREAEAMLKLKMYDGAYYLAGYAVECALKACIAKKTRRHDFPEKDFVRGAYTHEYWQLLRTAELIDQFQDDLRLDVQLAFNWTIVKDWKEDSRYAKWSERSARKLIKAITQVPHGVLAWIERHW